MGYILPVTSYQYSQYAERDVKNNYDPFKFVSVNPTMSIWSGKEKQTQIRANMKKFVREKHLKNKKVVEEIYSEITGKGMYFNESV